MIMISAQNLAKPVIIMPDHAHSNANEASLSFVRLFQYLKKQYRTNDTGLISCLIAALDKLVSRQLNQILVHSRFCQLEASWRSLAYLIKQAKSANSIKIKVLNVSKKQLSNDLQKAYEFDQSHLFKKVYSDEFDMPGGEPYGVLIGDYQFTAQPKDVALLKAIAQIAAAAFAPFISAAAPGLFGIDNFNQFSGQIDIERLFKQPDYLHWQQLRELEEARFVGLVLPQHLLRLPYRDYCYATANFCFLPDSQAYLWGNAAYAYAAVLIRAFAHYGWLANIRGVVNEPNTGGQIPVVVNAESNLDQPGTLTLPTTQVLITDKQEAELSRQGFIALCFRYGQSYSVVYNSPSIQRVKNYNDPVAQRNAQISAGLEHLFCACRFAHYIKKLGRDKLGSFSTAKECESFIQQWLLGYTASNNVLTPALRARYPLQNSQVQIKEVPAKPGSYLGIIHLQPYFQLEQVATTLILVTEFTVQTK